MQIPVQAGGHHRIKKRRGNGERKARPASLLIRLLVTLSGSSARYCREVIRQDYLRAAAAVSWFAADFVNGDEGGFALYAARFGDPAR
ncbi:hypothetical protein KCP73_15740 [Salmonella enterica subsp. enterica]|nr:hypothetical protein KCP73_15740 [Salmonella enterica subsp. enterica]